MLYTSVNNDYVKSLKKLNDKKYRDKNNLFLIEGEHLLKEADKRHLLKDALVSDEYELNINTEYNKASKNVLNYISSLENTTCIGVCEKLNGSIKGNKILLLDGIQDPGNLGTIIRSARAFDVDTIVLSKDSVDVYNPKVIRATQGMIFDINILYTDLQDTINELKNKNFKIYGTKVDNGTSLDEFVKDEKFVIIMGNEGLGIRPNILSLCDKYIYIPMNKNVESLNVGVATSIILYELR